jgi:molybdopterin/thiamine biosynthesis adenylyltransferase
MDYSRNWLFISQDTQKRLSDIRVLVAGVGIGSVFAELAVRTGISNLIIADGDRVEEHNLNRQNYLSGDIGVNKAKALRQRLLSINPEASIIAIESFLHRDELKKAVPEVDFVVNTIDFDSKDYEVCSDLCRTHQKIEIFPMNLGFGTALTVFDKSSPTWSKLFSYGSPEQLKWAILSYFATSPDISRYLLESQSHYFDLGENKPHFDPQLGISTYLTAAKIVSVIVSFIAGEKVDLFPHFYYLDAKNVATQGRINLLKAA